MTDQPGDIEEDSLGSQSSPGRFQCISHESSLLSSLPRMHMYWGDDELQWSAIARNPGTERGISGQGSFHHLCVFPAPQRECTRDQNLASPDVCPSAMLRDYAKHRPGWKTGALFVWESGKQEEAREIRRCLQSCPALAEEDAVGLSPHSFRIGAFSEAEERQKSSYE